MTPADHFLTGSLITAATLAAKDAGLSEAAKKVEHAVELQTSNRIKQQWSLLVAVLVGGLAGALADADFFWSVYGSSDPVRGHRGMSHSIPWAIVQGLVLAFLLSRRRIRIHWIYIPALIMASFSHVWLDSITPGGIWGGLPYWFPFSNERYGAWAYTGWVDFRLTLILLGTTCLLILIWLIQFLLNDLVHKLSMILVALLIPVVFGFCVRMILNSHYENEIQWMSYQKQQIQTFSPGIWSFVEQAFQFALRLFRAARAI